MPLMVEVPRLKHFLPLVTQFGDLPGARIELLRARQLDPGDPDWNFVLEASAGMKGKR